MLCSRSLLQTVLELIASTQLFDAIYENKLKLAKIIIDDSKGDVNIKEEYGDTHLIAFCKRTTLQTEGEAIRFINYLWERGFNFNTSNDWGKIANELCEE